MKLLLPLLLIATVATAQTKHPLQEAAELGQHIYQHTAPTGLVLVVVRDNEVFMQGYGRTSFQAKQAPGPDSLIRLCSLTKILTTDLFVKLALDPATKDKVALTTPLANFAPPNSTVPNLTQKGPSYRAITLGDLATHTAGLPREIAYPPNGAAHFTFPDYPYRWQWISTYRFKTQPGYAAHYSNISFDLLADALSSAANKPYAQLFAERTAKPLGLRDTTLAPTADQCARLLQGARNEGECTNTEAAAGSGGMYSTAHDMARFLQYLLGVAGMPAQAPQATAVHLLPDQLKYMGGLAHAGTPTGLGLGWVRIGDPATQSRLIEKTGGGAGFLTYIALNPATHSAIFVAETKGRHYANNLFLEANDLLLTLNGLPLLPRNGEENAPEPIERGRTHPAKTKLATRLKPNHLAHSAPAKSSRKTRTHTVKKGKTPTSKTHKKKR